jgi:predicted transcriptional regulator
MNKRDAAQILHREGYSQADIAEMMKVSTNTISKWATDGRWKEKKVSEELLQDNSVQRIIKLIDYQTKALERRVDAWLNEDEDSTKLIERGDIDALQKLYTTIRQDAKKFSDYVTVIKELLTFVQHKDLELAKRLTEPADEFINEMRKVL